MSSESDESDDYSSSSSSKKDIIVRKRSLGADKKRLISGPAIHVGHLRPFLPKPTRRTYRGHKKAPAHLLPILEGDRTMEDKYESMLTLQITTLFEIMNRVVIPAVGNAKAEEDAPRSVNRQTRTKSVSRRHQQNVLKEIAEQYEKEAAAKEAAASTKVDVAANASTMKDLIEDFDAAMDIAESLMTLEDLTWSGLFHNRYILSKRLSRSTDIEHYKSVVECFLSATLTNVEKYPTGRKQASKLMQYCVSHGEDPDGCLLGYSPTEEIAKQMRNALNSVYGENATRSELFEKVIAFDSDGRIQLLPSPMAHGELVVANVPNEGMKICRFSRVDPVRTHLVHVWLSAREKETTEIDMKSGVFCFDDNMRKKLSSDPKVMGLLVHSPLSPLHAKVEACVSRGVEGFMKKNDVDMYLIGLTEAQLASDSLDLSKYDESESGKAKLTGQALLKKLLSVFDEEKQKLLSLRTSIKQTEIEDLMNEVAEMVYQFMSKVNLNALFLPIKHVEIEAANSLSLQCMAAFQQTLDDRIAHVEELIDYVIVNWKKLSDVKLKAQLQSSGGSAIRSRSMSRGSGKMFLAKSQDQMGSPLGARLKESGTPGSSRKKGGGSSIRNLFTKKE